MTAVSTGQRRSLSLHQLRTQSKRNSLNGCVRSWPTSMLAREKCTGSGGQAFGVVLLFRVPGISRRALRYAGRTCVYSKLPSCRSDFRRSAGARVACARISRQ